MLIGFIVHIKVEEEETKTDYWFFKIGEYTVLGKVETMNLSK